MGDIRVDLETASRDELVAEIVRLHEVTERWSSAWQGIVAANTKAWVDEVDNVRRELTILQAILGER